MSVGHRSAKYQSPHHPDCLQERNVVDAKVLVLRSDGIGSARPSRRNGRVLSDHAT